MVHIRFEAESHPSGATSALVRGARIVVRKRREPTRQTDALKQYLVFSS